jgi:hypothetical protein
VLASSDRGLRYVIKSYYTCQLQLFWPAVHSYSLLNAIVMASVYPVDSLRIIFIGRAGLIVLLFNDLWV